MSARIINIVVDTGTWLKLDLLSERNLFKPDHLYEWSKVITTHQVEKELIHYQCKAWSKDLTLIVPVENTKIYEEALAIGFDDADASIASVGDLSSEKNIIITEDRPLLDYLRINQIAAIQFAELLQLYADSEKIEGKVFYRLVKTLQELRNITKKKLNAFLSWKAERF